MLLRMGIGGCVGLHSAVTTTKSRAANMSAETQTACRSKHEEQRSKQASKTNEAAERTMEWMPGPLALRRAASASFSATSSAGTFASGCRCVRNNGETICG